MDAEMWKQYRRYSQDKKRKNIKNSLSLLTESGIVFEYRANDAHIIINKEIDYYPSTGLFIVRSSGMRGRGVRNLIKALR